MKHNWEYKPFKQLSDILYGCPFESEFFNSESKGMPLIRIRDVKPGYTSTYFNGGYSDDYIIKKGDYLIGMDGEFNIAPWQSEDALLNQRVCRVKSINENVILSNFIYYFLGKELKDIEAQTSFVTVKHLSAKVLNAINTPVPPMEVQEQIVAELDTINETIEDCRELLRNLDALAQSLFYDTFGDPNINPKGWEMRKFAEVCDTFTDGDWIESKDQSTDGFRLIQTGNIGEGIYLDKSERSKFISADTFYSLKCKEVFEGDILISRLPDPIGRACILPKLPLRSITAVDCTIVRPKSFILPNFLLQYTLTDAYYNSLSSITKGATRKRVSRGNLGKILIPVPPISLQEQFAARIEQIEAQKKAVEQTIAELQTLLDSRMDYWFN